MNQEGREQRRIDLEFQLKDSRREFFGGCFDAFMGFAKPLVYLTVTGFLINRIFESKEVAIASTAVTAFSLGVAYGKDYITDIHKGVDVFRYTLPEIISYNRELRELDSDCD